MTWVQRLEGETDAQLVRRFMRAVEGAGVLPEFVRRSSFKTEAEERRRKSRDAARRRARATRQRRDWDRLVERRGF